MSANPTSTVIRAWARLLKARQLALESIELKLKAARLPPLAWYDALLELERAGVRGLRPFALESELLLSQCNLSRLIDRLERAGYLERRACPNDGRGQVIVITTAGKGSRRRMWSVYRPAIQSAVGAHLNKRQATALGETLGVLIAKSSPRVHPRQGQRDD